VLRALKAWLDATPRGEKMPGGEVGYRRAGRGRGTKTHRYQNTGRRERGGGGVRRKELLSIEVKFLSRTPLVTFLTAPLHPVTPFISPFEAKRKLDFLDQSAWGLSSETQFDQGK
jgi:hypothetical protein